MAEEHLFIWEVINRAASPDEHHQPPPLREIERVQRGVEDRQRFFGPASADDGCLVRCEDLLGEQNRGGNFVQGVIIE